MKVADGVAGDADVLVVAALGAEGGVDAGADFDQRVAPDAVVAVVEEVAADHAIAHAGLLVPEARVAFKEDR